jgi:HK97 family phage prohead protease
MQELHPKIKELKLRSKPVEVSRTGVTPDGNLVDLKIRVSKKEERVVKGYLTVWNTVDSYKTIWTKGCFAKSIRERGPDSQAKQKILFLWMHRQDEPLGQFRALVEDDYGLYFEAVIDKIPQGDRCLVQINSGTINQFSFGFDYIWDKVEWDEANQAVRIYEAELFEGSAVTFGANAETYAIRSKEQYNSAMEMLQEETEDFIKSVPRSQRLELRQLIARHISLAEIEPAKLESLIVKPLNQRKPEESKLNLSMLKFI